jgi:hypothetical protein
MKQEARVGHPPFNKAADSPPNKVREKKIGRIGATTFYGFKPGREAQ